ncbi:hypothetical protein PUNSTDRAFT_120356 [Punctularia strigosozonata HHB-11173 SS5]|uniref:uncharacterized protein n=1 Tax=Punctularia strigosozonata (strain HHB-11173) TaxID=741275 RepID=UPI00044171D0|nr:uncharacterized protein PUNSTDRAFT_120356 [Punctularia strigosozonata HHB-11173 SS5]EIN08773.1 hypothetical protein PUNSTDRAFT_120356 [Punctularia strigosozonata HHB-11173 SS5]
MLLLGKVLCSSMPAMKKGAVPKTAVTKRRFFETADLKVILRHDARVQASWTDSGRMELVCPDEKLLLQVWRKRRARCSFYCRTGDGSISLSLPRNFCGYLTLYSQHPAQFSRPLRKHVTLLSEDLGVSRYFIGKQSTQQGGDGDRAWPGDEIIADAGRWGITVSLVERCAFLRQL